MGQDFVNELPECRAILDGAEAECGFALETIINEGPMEELTRAAVLQPAITVTNLICLQALKQSLPESVSIACYAGHSLGEYSALCGAGVISVADTMKLVERRGFFMEREGLKNPGGMRAILGLGIDEVEQAADSYGGSGVVAVANYNTPQQIVISGSEDGLDGVSPLLEEKGARIIPLNVSVANHSPLVAEALPDFSRVIDSIDFQTPATPIYFNVTAQTEEDPAAIKQMMARQIVSRVRWYEIISSMIEDGVSTFIEVGPKTVLKGMMRKIVPKGTNIVSLQFDTPDSLASCLAELGLG
jgi:[acyl-carrier-protein] S-malonyltransferase